MASLFDYIANLLPGAAPLTYADDGFLRQGQEARAYTGSYTRERLPYLQITSAPFLSSVSEALNDYATSTQATTSRHNVSAQVSAAEQAFNQTLTQYSALDRRYMEAVLHREDPVKIKFMQDDLRALNEQLVMYAEQISDEIGAIPSHDPYTSRQIKAQQADLSDYVSRLKQTHAAIANAGALNEDANLNYKSIHLQYIVWLFVSVTVVAITAHLLLNDDASAVSGLVVIGLLLVVYGVAQLVGV
jgi:hypothetical protein